MSDKTNLGDRMKGYEEAVGPVLLRRVPLIVRVDGKAFHTLTKRLTPTIDPTSEFHFSHKFHKIMTLTACAMAQQIQNCQFAYTQSDEISFLLCDWKQFETMQWFDGKVQKIISVASAMASAYFNHFWQKEIGPIPDFTHLGLFDARAYNVPREDVDNYFLWRQRDAIRNSINFIARKFIPHKQLQGLNGLEIKALLYDKHGVAWDHYPGWEQRGSGIVPNPLNDNQHSSFIVDDDMPIISENRTYITKHMTFVQEK